MARLLSHPVDLAPETSTPLTGPQAIGSSSTDSLSGFNQSVASAFGLWEWQFTYPAMHGEKFRRFRGWVRALHGGANATRFPFRDPDRPTYDDLGLSVTRQQLCDGVPFENGQSWLNGKNWTVAPPLESVKTESPRDSTIIHLTQTQWGGLLGIGDNLGFTGHFGMYEVTEVFGDGRCRVWPILRKTVTVEDFATLKPVLAMRLKGPSAASLSRGLLNAPPSTVTMVEVLDYDVRDYFAD